MKGRLALLVAGCLAGCAPMPPSPPGDGTAPQSAALPLAGAGVTDAREAVAALFARELRRQAHDAPGHERVESWLHGVPEPGPDPDAASLRQVDAQFAARRAATSVLIVPGLFGDCVDGQSVPFGDGLPRPREHEAVESYAGYADLGLHSLRMLPLPGRASSAGNGALLAAALRAEAARPGVRHIVVLGYSKGLTDTLHAIAQLQAEGGVPPALQALVSVAGVVRGTPLADRFESLYAAWSPHINLDACPASDGTELASLTRREQGPWLRAHPLPPGLQSYTLLAWARADEMALPLRITHAWLAGEDARNDGQLLAGDAILPGSSLLATARSDHWDIALPRDRHPSALVRGIGSGRHFPREALLRASLRWVVAQLR